jgi:hypothetical protein
MPHLRIPIGPDGPVLDLGVWIGRTEALALVAQGRGVPPPLTVRALIDTGSDISAIHPLVAARLGSSSPGTVRLRRPGMGPAFHSKPLFDVRLAFGGARTGAAWMDLSVAGVPPSTPGILAIAGRDLLRGCMFLYDGIRGEFLLLH